jgi:NAD(P)-dependent dehydrogenase (short-subunit alcohol dehydrogenase family)
LSWRVDAGLAGRATLVTGAAGGIGRAVAEAYASTGARIAISDLDEGQLDRVLAGLDGTGHLALARDLRDPDAPQALVDGVCDRLGGIDVVVHTAAALIRREVGAVTVEEFDLQQEVNLRATFLLNRAAAEAMRRRGNSGRIINFVSQAWWTGGLDGSVVYAATKGGVVSMSRGLARTYAPDGILVNCIAPGGVDTPMFTEGLDDAARSAFLGQVPLGRLAKPDELAGVAVFLGSDHARYITGTTINVSGGQLTY